MNPMPEKGFSCSLKLEPWALLRAILPVVVVVVVLFLCYLPQEPVASQSDTNNIVPECS